MRVTVNDAPIPDGYTLTRCDRLTPDELLESINDEYKDAAREWVKQNPKEFYTEGERDALKCILYPQSVHRDGKMTIHNGYTTKHYKPESSDNR